MCTEASPPLTATSVTGNSVTGPPAPSVRASTVIAFPGIAEARAWWDSPAYQEIAPLRSRHIEGDIILVEGVPENYDPATTAKAMRECLPAE
ncbi:DUF1330 domain-containing protein [Streptomyces adustus]|uniref:DUF1330 domain-containing protein n=1 Tax=Streptomyces adustus TaxID=1609272 RepID=A0A5N8V6J6_9ACTN|nr:DUF1330 domain-containing protein [Streptomyces adustus]